MGSKNSDWGHAGPVTGAEPAPITASVVEK